jgi:hypothetical protein
VLADLLENVLPAYAIVSALALFAGTLLRRVKRGRLAPPRDRASLIARVQNSGDA